MMPMRALRCWRTAFWNVKVTLLHLRLLTSVAKELHHNSVILGIITPLHKQRAHVIPRKLFAVNVECLVAYPVLNAVEVGQITADADVSYEHFVVQFLFVALVAHLIVPPPCVVGSLPLSAAGEGRPPSPGPDLPGAGPSGLVPGHF